MYEQSLSYMLCYFNQTNSKGVRNAIDNGKRRKHGSESGGSTS